MNEENRLLNSSGMAPGRRILSNKDAQGVPSSRSPNRSERMGETHVNSDNNDRFPGNGAFYENSVSCVS